MKVTVIKTRSGTTYRLRRHEQPAGYVASYTVTRISEIPVIGYDEIICCDEVLDFLQPVVGQSWRFRTHAGPFRSSPVVSVTTDYDTVVLDNLDTEEA